MKPPICPLFTLFHPVVPVGTQFRPQTTQICIRVMLLESGPLQQRFCPAVLAPRPDGGSVWPTDAHQITWDVRGIPEPSTEPQRIAFIAQNRHEGTCGPFLFQDDQSVHPGYHSKRVQMYFVTPRSEIRPNQVKPLIGATWSMLPSVKFCGFGDYEPQFRVMLILAVPTDLVFCV